MTRRQVIALMGGTAAAWPLAARAQEPGRIYRIGCLYPSPRNSPMTAAFFDAVKMDGFIDGRNLVVDDHGFGLRVNELADHASAIAKAKVDLIVAAGEPSVRAAQQATKTIPILAYRGRYGPIGLRGLARQAWRQYDRHQHSHHRA